MKKQWLALLVTALLVASVTAYATGLPGLDALTAIARNAKRTPLTLPEVFEIVYRTPDGEVSLSRDADGNLTFAGGDATLIFLKNAEDSYLAAEQTDAGYALTDLTPMSFDQVKEKIAQVWRLIEPNEEQSQMAVVASVDGKVQVLGRDATRFREAVHEGTASGYDIHVTGALWYTFDQETGVCLMMETAPDESHDNAEAVFECVKYEIGK